MADEEVPPERQQQPLHSLLTELGQTVETLENDLNEAMEVTDHDKRHCPICGPGGLVQRARAASLALQQAPPRSPIDLPLGAR